MTALQMKAIDMLGQFPDDKIAYIIHIMEQLKKDTGATEKPRIGVGKGKTVFPSDIDFCNDEVAELFYGDAK